MERGRKRAVAVTAAVAAIGGGGVAVAATQLQSRQAAQKAVVSDAAKRLGVTPSALSNALLQAFSDRIDQAVASGQITKAEGDRMKARLKSGDLPIGTPGFGHAGDRAFGHDGPGDHGPGGSRFGVDLVGTAATYLGVKAADLHATLRGGKSLAQVVKAHGKSLDGLKQALTASISTQLDAAIKAGRLTTAQKKSMLAQLPAALDRELNEAHDHGGFGGPGGPGDGQQAPSSGFGTPSTGPSGVPAGGSGI